MSTIGKRIQIRRFTITKVLRQSRRPERLVVTETSGQRVDYPLTGKLLEKTDKLLFLLRQQTSYYELHKKP